MKATHHPLALIALLGLLAAGCASSDTGGGTVIVKWEGVDHFTDFAPQASGTRYSLIGEQRRLEHELMDLADAYIPSGCQVRITLLDVDRAGQAEGDGPRSTRIVTQQTPVRATFDYQAMDNDGKVVQQGHESLHLAPPGNQPTQMENDSEMPDIRELFRPWFRTLGGRLPKGEQ